MRQVGKILFKKVHKPSGTLLQSLESIFNESCCFMPQRLKYAKTQQIQLVYLQRPFLHVQIKTLNKGLLRVSVAF